MTIEESHAMQRYRSGFRGGPFRRPPPPPKTGHSPPKKLLAAIAQQVLPPNYFQFPHQPPPPPTKYSRKPCRSVDIYFVGNPMVYEERTPVMPCNDTDQGFVVALLGDPPKTGHSPPKKSHNRSSPLITLNSPLPPKNPPQNTPGNPAGLLIFILWVTLWCMKRVQGHYQSAPCTPLNDILLTHTAKHDYSRFSFVSFADELICKHLVSN